MPDVTFLSHISETCNVTLHNPSLIVAWAQALAGLISPDQYLDVYKHAIPNNPEALANAKLFVERCIASGT